MAEKNKQTEIEEELSAYEQLSNTQKCAILMMLLGEDEAAEILKNLGPKEVQQLGKEMYTVQGLDQDTVNQVLDEFLAIIKTQTDLGMGSSNYIRNVMTKALGENKAQSVLGRITPTESDKPIEILDWMDARSVTELISDEHPQIMSLIISYLDAGVAADVLVLLPEEIQADIIHRIATLETVQPDALAELERVMQLKFKTNTSLRASSVGGVKAAAQIMNFTKQNMEQRIVKSLGEKDRLLAKEIQESMFTFDTLILMDDRSMQTLIRNVDQEVLIIALKGTEEELKKKIFASMSQRASANIQDEMEVLGPLRLTEVQEAQKAIINTARTMSDEGTIVLAGRGGDDFV
ncbi:MAG: flagellar motor switch protein FliG [Rickettsiales bacterium TMED254]|nr:flagellar motor switch protein FliG [Rickettsiales bacterium]RPF75953.1 MAG: flagellar motor switch protein FliG [Rickettsiales bacterium TMED254]|tara:strand:+ start:137 stop:1183 length:1047 start_codon:yes stop_codon:yes gene_type:complete